MPRFWARPRPSASQACQTTQPSDRQAESRANRAGEQDEGGQHSQRRNSMRTEGVVPWTCGWSGHHRGDTLVEPTPTICGGVHLDGSGATWFRSRHAWSSVGLPERGKPALNLLLYALSRLPMTTPISLAVKRWHIGAATHLPGPAAARPPGPGSRHAPVRRDRLPQRSGSISVRLGNRRPSLRRRRCASIAASAAIRSSQARDATVTSRNRSRLAKARSNVSPPGPVPRRPSVSWRAGSGTPMRRCSW